MKKIMMVSLMLTIAMALQAQVKVAPKMEKGRVKTYVAEATITLPGQGDVKVTADSKYTITDATADGFVLEMVSTDVKTECDPGNIAGKLIRAQNRSGSFYHASQLYIASVRNLCGTEFGPAFFYDMSYFEHLPYGSYHGYENAHISSV